MKTINQPTCPVNNSETTNDLADLEFLKEVSMLRCQDCEQVKDDVEHTFCPFAADIYSEEVPITVCESCLQNRADDI